VRALGMITACFPHVDEETRNILQSAMEDAKDLTDFAEILCDKVCKESDNPLAIYFAYFYALTNDIWDKLREAGKYSVLAEPLLRSFDMPGGMVPEWSDSQRMIREALKAAPNDWIACHIYMEWRIDAERRYTECFTDSGVMRVLESKIENDEDYSYFLPHLYQIRAYRLAIERSMDEAIRMYDLVIHEAIKHDHPIAHLVTLLRKANLIKRKDVEDALVLLKQHREISEEFGVTYHLANNHHQLGLIAMARGEFNLALHHQLKRNEIGTQVGWDQREFAPRIAMLHNMMGDGATALEIIVSHQDESYQHNPLAIIQEAWALVNLGNINEAETEISKAREIILKSDDEVRLGLIYLVEGLIEKAKLDFDNAKFTLERALDIFERYLSVVFINIALIHLCDIEIESITTGSKNIEISGPWMTRLLYQMEKKDLPGFEAQAKLLKAKFLMKQAQIEESSKLVFEVQKLSKSQNMEYLEKVVEVLIPKVRE